MVLQRFVQALQLLLGGLTCVFLAGIVTWSLVSLVPYLWGENPLPPWARRIVPHLDAEGKARDVVLFCGITRATAEYALVRHGIEERFRMASFPAEAGLHRGWYDPAGYQARLPELSREAVDLARRLHAELVPGGQLWLLYENRYPELHQSLLDELTGLFGPYRRGRSKLGVGLYCFVK